MFCPWNHQENTDENIHYNLHNNPQNPTHGDIQKNIPQQNGWDDSMAITSFNRLYRPQFFRDVVGQDHGVLFLTRAFLQGKMPQALLFSGSHGLGKTTLARLTAKLLCCLNPQGQEPCNHCESCLCFHPHRPVVHSDVVEWDGASYTSVDDVRPMIETCAYAPMMSRAKVFIIDEVHMLSRSAFNALLKIIEEPPRHVYFFFATTQRDKIPSTILSRCHDIVLHTVSLPLIQEYIKKIHQEQTQGELPQNIAESLALHSHGSLRDALKLLEQHLLFPQNIYYIEDLWRYVLDKKADLVVQGVDNLLNNGVSPEKILEEFLFFAYKDQERGLLDKNTGNNKNIGDQKSLLNHDLLWQILHQGYKQLRDSPFPSLSLKMILTRLFYIQDLTPFLQENPKEEKNNSLHNQGNFSFQDSRKHFSPNQENPCLEKNSSQFSKDIVSHSHESSSLKKIEENHSQQISSQISSQKNSSQISSTKKPESKIPEDLVFHPKCFPEKPHILRDLLVLAQEKRQGLLYAHLYQNLGFVDKKNHGSKGEWIFTWNSLHGEPPENLFLSLETFLEGYEGKNWTVTILEGHKNPPKTLQEEEHYEKETLYEKILHNTQLSKLKKHFSSLKILSIEPLKS